jgi:hypothetical protein
MGKKTDMGEGGFMYLRALASLVETLVKDKSTIAPPLSLIVGIIVLELGSQH